MLLSHSFSRSPAPSLCTDAASTHARCLDSPGHRIFSLLAGESRATDETLARALALGVARWQAASRSDALDHKQLDGSSPCCLFRAIMYQRSDVCSIIKEFLFSGDALRRLPVRTTLSHARHWHPGRLHRELRLCTCST